MPANKRYWCFAGNEYYPEGGARDLLNSGDDIDGLVNEWKQRCSGIFTLWCHIFDTHKMEIVQAWVFDPDSPHGKFMQSDLNETRWT